MSEALGPVPPANQAHCGAHEQPQNGPIFLSCKIPELFEKSPFSEVGKHHDFQVTSCLHFVTTIANFAYIKSE
jgi:hypothetical protein